ncbi:MAG: chromosome segregation protein SMC [Pseudomonadota bacterium]
MQFKRLRLAGFKSFVDPTELWIEPGLTGIVGPNGCGKSNLLEALRWVMGESRPKSLRGGGMEDVIFAGTDTRPRRNLADVTLLIDNADRTAPAQYNELSDLEVSRRIERDLGSLYKINGGDVRQKDVQLLFADAATGATSPALVSQGRVGALINSKPQERRQLLEDAAGISGLHSRRKEAEQKLKAAGTNLERLEDVLLRMDGQANALRRQAKQAVRYRTLSDLIRALEAQLLYAQWRAARRRVETARQAFDEAEMAVAKATGVAAQVAKLQAAIAADMPVLRQNEAEAAAGLSRLEAQAATLHAEKERLGTLQSDLARRLDDADKDQAREADYARDAAGALEKAQADITRLSDAMAGDGPRAETLKEALKTAQDGASAAQAKLDDATQALAQAKARDETTRGALRAAESDLDQTKRALEHQRTSHGAMSQNADARSALGETQAMLDSAEDAAEKAQTAFEAAQSKEEKTQQSLRECQERADDAKSALRRLESEISGVKAALSASSQSGARTPIADLITIDLGFERALGAALGDGLDLPIDEGTRHWRASAPVQDDPALPDALTPLSAKVSAAAHLGRRLAQTGIAETKAQAEALMSALKPGQQIVTQEGGLWRWDGLRASADAPTQASLRLAQRNHLKSLESQLPDIAGKAATAEQTVSEAKAGLDQVKSARVQTRAALEQATQAAQKARRTMREAETQSRAMVEKLSTSAALLESRKEAVTKAAGALTAAQTAAGALPDLTDQHGAIERQRGALNSLRAKLADTRARYDSHIAAAQGRKRAHERALFERKQWQDRAQKANAQKEALAERRAQIATALEELKHKPKEIEKRQAALGDSLEEMREKRRRAADALAQKETEMREHDSARTKAQEALSLTREARGRCEAEASAASASLEEIAQRCESQFNQAPAQLLDLAKVESEDDIRGAGEISADIERRKLERERLGAVNLRADIELQELEEEAARLRAEKDELETAIARLRGAIGSLNREGRTRLMTAFDEVNAHFGQLFTTLFGGGSAHIKLIESDDPLEAGLEIMASPPGKKLQALSLLSGGEQALTALSLIFAVFMTNPAPICVLDEVDAPLDDANVERFCTLLEEMVGLTKTRFLIVTHNALTMSRMHRLFGVTMAERGVSQLVSVDLQQAETMVAAE